MSSPAQRATRAARDVLNQALRDDVDRRRFRIDKFGRHRDGYLHARIIVDGTTPVYFHCKWGSWLAPGSFRDGRSFLKEPEALLGSELGRVVKYTLSETARRFHPQTTTEEEDDDNGGPDATAQEPGGNGPAVPDAGVPEGGDRQGTV